MPEMMQIRLKRNVSLQDAGRARSSKATPTAGVEEHKEKLKSKPVQARYTRGPPLAKPQAQQVTTTLPLFNLFVNMNHADSQNSTVTFKIWTCWLSLHLMPPVYGRW